MRSSWRPLMLFVRDVRWALANELAGFRVAFIPPDMRRAGARKKSPGSGAGAGMLASFCRGAVLQLPILSEHLTARAAHAPAMRGERGAAAKHVTPGHSGGAVTQPRRGRSARREFGEINGAGTRGPYADKKARG